MKKKLIGIGIMGMFLMVAFASAVNVENIKSQSKGYGGGSGGSDISIYDLLIITPKKFTSALQLLVNHKNNVAGVSTRMITLDEVYDEMFWYGRDKPEKIKYFIKTAEEEWGIKYVLLVGDFKNMPIRYCYNSLLLEFYPEPCFISELYYADIYDKNGDFSSWDTNNNGIYGEWTGDKAEDKGIDLYPDVYVGRLACRDKSEVEATVKKIITYETETYGKSWFKKVVGVGGDSYPEKKNPKWVGYEGEENSLRVFENMPGFIPTKLFTSDGSLKGPRDVIRAVNKGCGFLYFYGHSNPFQWSTHPPNDPDTWVKGLSVATMSLLRNKEMLPICVVGGCHNSQFDVHFAKIFEDPWSWFTWIPECWSWKLTRMIGGGSIATIGYTGIGIAKEDKDSFEGASEFLDVQFFYEYGMNDTHILGEAWGKAIINYLKEFPIDWNTPAAWDYAFDARTVQQWALLGDPSLKIGGYGNAPTSNLNDEATYIGPKPNRPSGPTSGKPEIEYTFTAHVASDNSWDKICYFFDWGDGTYSDPFGPYPTDQVVEVKHIWNDTDIYEVKIMAWLINSNTELFEETAWSDPLIISISKNKQLINLEAGIYVENVKIPFPIPITIFVGDADIEIDAEGASKVEFYLDDDKQPRHTDYKEPYEWLWNEFSFGSHTLKVVAYDNAGNSDTDEMTVWKFF